MGLIETARLRGRRLCTCDFDTLRLFHANPSVMTDLGGVRDEKATKQNLAWNLNHWEKHGFGLWVIIHKENDAILGLAGFREIEFLGKQEADLAYMVLPEYWNQGFAFEISKDLLRSAFEIFGLPSLIAKTRVSNRTSQRVIQKLNFVFENEVLEFGSLHLQYRLSKDGWFKHQALRD